MIGTDPGSTSKVKWLLRLAVPLALAADACAGREAATVAVANPTPRGETCSLDGKSIVVPLMSSSSSVALAKVGSDTIALIADEDARRVYAVDVDTKAELGYVDLEQAPSNLIIAKSGRVAVTLPGSSLVEVLSFDGKNLSPVCAVPTDPEPVALALTPDEHTLLVTSGWGHSLGAFKSADLQPLYRVDLPREPRAVVISDDGTRAFVSHALGSVLSVVDLGEPKRTLISLNGGEDRSTRKARKLSKMQLEAQGRPAEDIAAADQSFEKPHRMGTQGFALAKTNSPSGRILVPQVLVDPGRAEQRTQGYGQDDDETQIPSVAVVDAHALKPLESSLEVATRWSRGGLLNGQEREECVLPHSAAVDPTSGALLVTCLGSDLVVGLDAASAAPVEAELFRARVATGPTGIAVDAAHGRAIVWSQFERVLNILTLPETGAVGAAPAQSSEQIALSKAPAREPSLEFQMGRRLFFASGDPRIAKDGRACASCHIGGRDDGLVWATPNGPRRTKVLAGLVTGTAPYSWDGAAPGLRDQVGHTFERLRGLGGLRGIELKALLGYVSALPPPPAATEPQPANSVERGATVFASKQAGCAECHAGPQSTDGHLHDVATRTEADRGATFDTPSLHGISGRAPYFHDGRYATLRELLEKSAGTMGQAQRLPAEDLDALEAFLRTL